MVSRLTGAGWKAWEIEGTEWKLARRNSQKREKRALQCEQIFSWFLFILQIVQIAQPAITSICSTVPRAETAPERCYGSQWGCQSGSGSLVTWRIPDPSERMINISA